MASEIYSKLESDRVYTGLVRTRPADPQDLAAVLEAGVKGVKHTPLILIARDRLAGYRGYKQRLRMTVEPEDIGQWPWGLALFLDNPPTELLALQEGSCKPPPELWLGEELGIPYEIWATEGGPINVQSVGV